MIYRDITTKLQEAARQCSTVALFGPRQSGKTTLIHSIFPDHHYVNLRALDIRAQAVADPRSFLKAHANESGIILDDIEYAPELLAYIQTIIDRVKKKGYFIITGSQNLFGDSDYIQKFAGNLAIHTLLPLTINELQQVKSLPNNIEETVYLGMYPSMHTNGVSQARLYENYIRSYIERDVRHFKNIGNIEHFHQFMKLCAGRTGQILNLTSLGDDCGIDHKTARSWLSLLEATYIVFLLQPYHTNFGKRLIKSPKIYFVDTGVACSLLGIKNSHELTTHHLRSGLVESFIISDLFKQCYNLDQKPSLYLWRDHTGNEIDCLIERGLHLTPLEIKAGRTISGDYFKQFAYFKKLKSLPATSNIVVYAGDDDQKRPEANVISWRHAGNLIETQ